MKENLINQLLTLPEKHRESAGYQLYSLSDLYELKLVISE